MPRCLVAVIKFRNILFLLTHVDAIQRKSYEYHSPWDHGNQNRVPPPSVGPPPCVAEFYVLSSLREDLRASIYLFCTYVCLVWRVKLFSRGIPRSKTFFTILGKGGIDCVVSVRVLTVSSSAPVFYSDSKTKYFPKNTSPRGRRLFAVHFMSITGYLKVLLVSWKFVSQFRNTKIWCL